METKILFVDDEANVLRGLRRMLRGQKQWSMEFANGGVAALEILEDREFDVIVSDMRMPEIDGAELLSRVANSQPQTVRLVLSGQSEHEKIFRAVGPAHQYLTKPCNPDTLIETIEQVIQLQNHLNDPQLLKLIGKIERLPSLPTIYMELIEALNRPDESLDTVSEIISRDIGMTAKILHLVNSSFFGIPHHVECPKHAVSLLGIDIVRALALSVSVFEQYQGGNLPGFSLENTVNHSLNVAVLAREIARAESADKYMIDDAFIAGMMHDVGKLILSEYHPEKFKEAIDRAASEEIALFEAEQAVMGTTHGAIGAHLLGLWGLPSPIVEAVALHHTPELTASTQFSPLTAVFAANLLVECEPEEAKLEEHSYINQLALRDRVTTWNNLST